MFDIVEFVKQQERFFCEALTEPTLTWAKESQFAIQQFQKNAFLADTARANLPSAQNAIINVAAIGITLNPASKLAYLVPRKKAVCLDISYMGLLHLAQVTGAIQWGQCKLVYEKDIYESNGIDCAPTHKYNPFVDRSARIGGYCVVKTSEGDYLTEEMSNREIEVIRACSKAGNNGGSSPWDSFPDEMARKAIVKRASKYWPRRDRLDTAIDYLNTQAGEGIILNADHIPERDVTPASDEIINEITQAITEINKTWDDLLPLCSKTFRRTIASHEYLSQEEAVKTLDFVKKKAARNKATAEAKIHATTENNSEAVS
ncbi:recombinase RecT [Escherichia coli]|nr:recombinase RecT [Escherichia coli]